MNRSPSFSGNHFSVLQNMNSAEKKRSSKTTRGQYELYLDELSTNKHFRDNKFDATNPDIIENTWQGLCIKLNALGGPVKSVPEWKRVGSLFLLVMVFEKKSPSYL